MLAVGVREPYSYMNKYRRVADMAEVLIAGSTGGREHALGLALAGEHTVEFTHGGNAGTREIGANLAITDNDEIADYAAQTNKDLVIIGPEAPLVADLASK